MDAARGGTDKYLTPPPPSKVYKESKLKGYAQNISNKNYS
jgi:hypothetical protein